MKADDMAALDVDSSKSDFMQQEEGTGNQVRFFYCIVVFVIGRGCGFSNKRACITYLKLGGGYYCTLIWTSQATLPPRLLTNPASFARFDGTDSIQTQALFLGDIHGFVWGALNKTAI